MPLEDIDMFCVHPKSSVSRVLILEQMDFQKLFILVIAC